MDGAENSLQTLQQNQEVVHFQTTTAAVLFSFLF